MPQINIIGVGLGPQDLSATHLELIEGADILVGGRRILDWFNDHPGQKHVIDSDLSGLIDFIQANMDQTRIVVLASGDPLFYGIGRYLKKKLGQDNLTFYPNVSSVAAGFARLKIPYDDAACVSLHGRDNTAELWRALAESTKIAVLTDTVNTPAWLAEQLLKRPLPEFEMWVLERLGQSDERVACYEISEAAGLEFAQPNIVILLRRDTPSALEQNDIQHIGVADENFAHQRGLITKAEVRAVTISKLRLRPADVLWDLGAGSGSVAIEATFFLRSGAIYAVEKEKSRCQQIRANAKHFGINNLKVIEARLPEGLDTLPKPDRVFIGGGGKDLGAIIKKSVAGLNKTGVVVVNTVILANAQIAFDTLTQAGFKTAMVQVQISRSRKMPGGPRLAAENPVFIISGEKLKNDVA
jgi:precorrin-6B C5,15-methyltransferase / cobalt-precorrin-6B C5,C15-methyltransferase